MSITERRQYGSTPQLEDGQPGVNGEVGAEFHKRKIRARLINFASQHVHPENPTDYGQFLAHTSGLKREDAIKTAVALVSQIDEETAYNSTLIRLPDRMHIVTTFENTAGLIATQGNRLPEILESSHPVAYYSMLVAANMFDQTRAGINNPLIGTPPFQLDPDIMELGSELFPTAQREQAHLEVMKARLGFIRAEGVYL